MKTHVGVIFWQRTDKINKQGLAPVSCRLTHGGKATELSTGIRVAPAEWGGTHRRVLGKSEAARRANSYLLQMHNALENIVADLDRQGKPVTAQSVARHYQKGGVLTLSLLGLFEAFLVERQSLVGIDLSAGTIAHNRVRYNRLAEFLKEQRLTELRPEEMTHTMADKLLYWLLKDKGFKRSSANKVVQIVFQVLQWGVRREYLDKNSLTLYQVKGQAAAEIKFLTEGELAHLTSLALPTGYLTRARDCFVFQCWTGLAYADLAALNVLRDAEYHTDRQQNVLRVLRVTRAKSTMHKGYECVIPLLPEAERLLAAYGDKLPVPTNQVYNRFLKELGELAGIEADKMHSHVGRKTAGTLMLNRGATLSAVSKFLGHANVLITQKLYAKLLDTTVIDAFGALFSVAASTLLSLQPGAPLPLRAPIPAPTRPAHRLHQ